MPAGSKTFWVKRQVLVSSLVEDSNGNAHPHMRRTYGRLYIIASVSKPRAETDRFAKNFICGIQSAGCAKKKREK